MVHIKKNPLKQTNKQTNKIPQSERHSKADTPIHCSQWGEDLHFPPQGIMFVRGLGGNGRRPAKGGEGHLEARPLSANKG